MKTTLLETCQIPPPPGAGAGAGAAAAKLTLPLSFFDIKWLHFHPIRRLLFFDYPCSKPCFIDTIVPQLKQSLSLTLKHFLPVAGNLLYPSEDTDQKKPLLRYISGDSVSLTIAESSHDLGELVGNHARDADQFYDFVPQMPPVTDEPGFKVVPVLACQVTLFPGRGICLGFSNHHSLGDARSVVSFTLAWASINKHGGEDEFLNKKGESLPLFDRSVIEDPRGIDNIFWETMRRIPFKPSSFPVPTNRVRATFVLTQPDINKLKKLVSDKNPSLQASSFIIVASYVWTCLVKSREQEADVDRAAELLIMPADARARIRPPVPANYFGNCIVGGIVIMEHEKVVGDDGFLNTAEAVSEEIKRLNNKDEILKGAENWISDFRKFRGMNALGISGSPKFDLAEADFGWGKARKLEIVSIDGEKCAMSLSKSMEFEGGLEIGLSLSKEKMEAFAATFSRGLSS